MPGQQNATNARRRVEQRLAEIQGGGARGTLLPALVAIANARGAVPNAKIEGITFREGTVDLRIDASGCGEPRCHRSAAARGELAGGHHGWQRER